MSKPITYARRLVKGSVIIFTALVALQIIAILLRMFLARSLSVAEYGLFYAVIAFISFLGLFRGVGFDSALIKHIPEFEIRKRFDKIKSSLIFTLLLRAVLAFSVAIVLFALSNQIALAVFGTTAAVLPIQILAIWSFLMIFFIFTVAFAGFQNMPMYALMKFFDGLFVFLLALLLVGGLGLGVGGVAFAYLLTALVMGILGFALLRRGYPRVFEAKTSITKPLVKKLSAYALPAILGGIGSLIIAHMDTLMITALRSLPEVGFYQAAQPTARFLWYFAGALTVVFLPMVSELWARRERKLLGDAAHLLIKFSFMFIIPAALIFIAFPDIIIRLLFGSNYLAGTVVLQILAGCAVINILYVIGVQIINGVGKPIINTKIVASMACLNLGLNLLLIPMYGINGAAIATFFAFTIGLVLTFYYARRFVKFTVPTSPLLKTLAGGVLTLLLIFSLKHIIVLPPWPEAFAVVIPSLLFYGVWILTTKAVTRDDLTLVKRIVPIPGWLVKAAGKFVRS